MNFAVAAECHSSRAVPFLRDTPAATYYTTTRQRLHLSTAKRCADKAGHLSFRPHLAIFSFRLTLLFPKGMSLLRYTLVRLLKFGVVALRTFPHESRQGLHHRLIIVWTFLRDTLQQIDAT